MRLLWKDQLDSMSASIVMIDESNVASHADERSRRDVISDKVCALNFFLKKFDNSGARGCRQSVYHRT